ncbi:MAG TPA: polyhydroxyalkanoic acid system family protein [Myxococcota bacterium]|nr:polyhydroxyalkanoic acid system family protein [Myxococcota bacterium]HOD08193.1 polyhydroxyalkanoic acid system family protein [Myxococcota bacterium]HPB51703.1 polyhydroxyalkanoic acid system family protein [Myxococcota bacterium]HQP96717.1 polyhydroxyalkanoic acid system family protein [Myxococcota bacterium]
MAKKSYEIEHEWDEATAIEKLKPFANMLVSAYDLKMTENAANSYTFTRAGVRADIVVSDKVMKADIDLNMLLEGIVRPKLEEMIERKVRPMFKKA